VVNLCSRKSNRGVRDANCEIRSLTVKFPDNYNCLSLECQASADYENTHEARIDIIFGRSSVFRHTVMLRVLLMLKSINTLSSPDIMASSTTQSRITTHYIIDLDIQSNYRISQLSAKLILCYSIQSTLSSNPRNPRCSYGPHRQPSYP